MLYFYHAQSRCHEKGFITAGLEVLSNKRNSLDYSMIVELLSEYQLEFLSLKLGCRGSFEFTLVKMPHCWKSLVAAHIAVIDRDHMS